MKKGTYIRPRCIECNTNFVSNHKSKFCSKEHKAVYERRQMYVDFNESNVDEWVECKICGLRCDNIARRHLKYTHNITNEQYREMYPDAPLFCKNTMKRMSDRMTGEKNIAFQHGGKMSPFSKNFVGYSDLTEQEKEEKIKVLYQTSTKNCSENNNQSTRISYYTSRGYSQEEAEKLLSERQTTFTLEKCIEKHGEEKGRKIWQARQDKWMATLDSKSDEEKAEINRKKGFRFHFKTRTRNL